MALRHALLVLVAALVLPLAGAAAETDAAPADFAARFVQTRTLPDFTAPLVSRGVVRFSGADDFAWTVEQPYHYAFVLEGGRAHETLPDGTRRDLAAGEVPWLALVQRIFAATLSGDEQRLARYFDIHEAPAASGRVLVLEPRAEAITETIRRIRVEERRPGAPRALHIEETGGGRMDIRFTPLDAAGAP